MVTSSTGAVGFLSFIVGVDVDAVVVGDVVDVTGPGTKLIFFHKDNTK